MSRANSEEYKKYQRELMRRRRAEAKDKQAGVTSSPAAGDAGTPEANLKPFPKSPRPATKTTKRPSPATGEALKTTDHQPTVPAGDKFKTLSRIARSDETAAEVGARTRELLNLRGWILWKLHNVDGEIICIIRDESVEGYPERFPVFTEDEIIQMHAGGADLNTYRLVIEAKKTAKVAVVAE